MMMNFDMISTIGEDISCAVINVPKIPPKYELTSMLNTASIEYKTELYKGFTFDLNVIFLFIKYAAM